MEGTERAKAVILVVDDEDEIRELCRVNLEFEGYAVVEASDGVEALMAADREQPDLIFLDLMMPRMDGWEVLRRLTATTRAPRIPVGQTCRTSVPMHPGDLGTDLLHEIEAPRS